MFILILTSGKEHGFGPGEIGTGTLSKHVLFQ